MGAVDAKVVEQRGRVIGHLARGVGARRSRGPAGTAVVKGDDAEALRQRWLQHRPPEGVAAESGDQQERRTTAGVLVVEVEPIDGSERHRLPPVLVVRSESRPLYADFVSRQLPNGTDSDRP